MAKQKLGRGLTQLMGVPALSTKEAAADDVTDTSVACEFRRYERQILDFENDVCRRRDAMRAEHLANMREIVGE